jgi:hypothetical protein
VQYSHANRLVPPMADAAVSTHGARRFDRARPPIPSQRLDVVLAAAQGSGAARDLARPGVGDRVCLTWSFGLPDVLDVAGGQPVL